MRERYLALSCCDGTVRNAMFTSSFQPTSVESVPRYAKYRLPSGSMQVMEKNCCACSGTNRLSTAQILISLKRGLAASAAKSARLSGSSRTPVNRS